MQFGMPTMVELPDLEANAAVCRRLGLDFVEINMNLPMYQADGLDTALKLREEYGVGFTIHLDENFAPADFNPLLAQAHLETLRQTIRAAKHIGAPVLNMHMSRGVYFKLPDRVVYLYGQYQEQYLRSMRLLRELCEAEIGEENICVCIENTDGYMDYQREAIDFLLESNVFALTWDIGHSHTAPIDDVPFQMKNRRRLAHFHIHDANSKRNHLVLGEGEVDLDRYLTLADERGARCVIETKTVAALENSVGWLQEHGWIKKIEK